MKIRLALSLLLSVALVPASLAGTARGQSPVPSKPQPRKLAPGVLTVIPPAPQPEETYTGPIQLRDMPVHAFTPNYAPKTETVAERAKHVVLRRPVWNFELAFKPLRMIETDVPQPNGKLKRKLIWYLVYRIRNLGHALQPKPVEDKYGHKLYQVQPSRPTDPELLADRFFPLFVLEGLVPKGPLTEDYQRVAYTDRLIPAAVEAIQQKEDPAIKLLNSVEISQQRIAPGDENSPGIWGVATWEDVDPRIDYVSVFVRGLTNAFRYRETADGKKIFTHKTLQLNFWRPGDIVEEIQDKIRYGVPLVSDPREQAKIFQRYQIPGPVICGYEVDPATGIQRQLFEADPQLDAKYRSPLRQQLDGGTLPDVLRQQFAAAGVKLPANLTLTTILAGSWWDFKATVGGASRSFRLRYQPKYWEMTPDGLDVKERVDHLWVYR